MANKSLAESLGREIEEQTERDLMTPDNVPISVSIADLGSRVAAALIDFFIFALISDLLLAIGAFLFGARFNWGGTFSYLADNAGMVSFVFLTFLVRMIYFPAFEHSWAGQTPGKRALQIRVINRHGAPLTLEAVLVRNIAREIEFWLPLSLVATPLVVGHTPGTNFWASIFLLALVAVVFTNAERMRGGDMLAGTWVVSEPSVLLLPELATRTGSFSQGELRQYGVKQLEVLAEVLRESGPQSSELRRKVSATIHRRLGRQPDRTVSDAEFLARFYAALREHLEKQKMTTGTAQSDKSR